MNADVTGWMQWEHHGDEGKALLRVLWSPGPPMVTASKDVKEWDSSPIRYGREYLDSKDSRQYVCKITIEER